MRVKNYFKKYGYIYGVSYAAVIFFAVVLTFGDAIVDALLTSIGL